MIMPWEEHEYNGIYERLKYVKYGYGSRLVEFTHQQLKDSPAMVVRKGDIVKFKSGYIYKDLADWKGWFVKGQDKRKFYPVDKRVPKYARNRIAIVAGRFRRIKHKSRNYYDYGTTVMMLSGPKVGHFKNYWLNRPFNLKVSFPNQITQKYILNCVDDDLLEILSLKYNDTDEGRNLLLQRLYEKIFGG